MKSTKVGQYKIHPACLNSLTRGLRSSERNNLVRINDGSYLIGYYLVLFIFILTILMVTATLMTFKVIAVSKVTSVIMMLAVTLLAFATLVTWKSYRRHKRRWANIVRKDKAMRDEFFNGEDTSLMTDDYMVGVVRKKLKDCLLAEITKTGAGTNGMMGFHLSEPQRQAIGKSLDIAKTCLGDRVDNSKGLKPFFDQALEEARKTISDTPG